jgi:sugar/nucleoside kinase (ribokinase family)
VPSLLVAGTLTLDTTHRAGQVHARVPGGSALYAALAARLAVPVKVVGTVGTDFPLDVLTSGAAVTHRHPIDTSAIAVIPGPTFHWTASYSDNGDERTTIGREPGVEADRLPVIQTPAGPGDALLLGSMHPRTQAFVRNACPHAGLVALDSMTHWWQAEPDALRELLARVQIVFVNEEELQVASPRGDPDDLHRLGPDMVVVKCGSRGAWLQRRGGSRVEVAATTVAHLVDPTGAGDAFAGACLSMFAAHPDTGDAEVLRYAATVAAFAVEGIGTARLVRTTPDDVLKRAHE